MSHTPTVTVRFTQAISQAAEQLGFSLPAPLKNAFAEQERVSLELQGEIWETFCQQADDPLIGIQFGLAIQVGHLDTVGMVLMSCDTVAEALDSLIDYYPIVGEGGTFEYAVAGDVCEIRYQPQYTTRLAERVEAALASLLQLTRWSTGEQLQANSISVSHPALADPDRYQQLLGVPVEFEAAHNSLRIPAAALSLPLIYANPALCQHLRTLADQLLEQLGSQSLSVSVRDLLRQNPRWGKEKVAEQLAMSGRHLIRKLSEEGTSFKLLRDSLLQGMAEQSLKEGLKLFDIADKLGFSDESAFAKAFKRWTGMTPAQFRSQP
ncbi:AraC family transcriptional regulator [Alcanivorax sp. DG881]|uniref:AraC family transcriptional regulator n=1 Tax=Alcanivorax sp. DG881 TaxID=236097 RepID=UPI00017EB5C6|nr:AraC family transcriptional regulator [Alcanivorax sp. DG881]EDX91031.1 transcriptional regulator, AraC family protein [Alcanivorax sp. DG881]